MSETAPVQYNGRWYNTKQCDNCAKAGMPGKNIFFIDTGEINPQTGKKKWELRNADTTLHQHVPGAQRSWGGGGGKAPEVVDVHLQPIMTSAMGTEGFEVNNANIAGLLASGWKVSVNKQTHQPYIEKDSSTGAFLLVMVKVKEA